MTMLQGALLHGLVNDNGFEDTAISTVRKYLQLVLTM